MFLLPLQSIITTSRRPKKSLTILNLSLALQKDFKVTNYFEMMQKKKKEPKSTFYKFYKSVGHEDKNCRNLDLIKEITLDVYRI